MNEIKNCPNCGTELKSGLMSEVRLFEPDKIKLINIYNEKKAEGYCTKCGKKLYQASHERLTQERSNLNTQMQSLIKSIPVISTHTPLNWDYEVLDMVTGQSTTGTGVISEFTSSFSDLFGVQSGQHNKKLKNGENMCFAQLRLQTVELGGNAVIATDIDYSEVGSVKGMLMVCMAGTAIKLKNPQVLGEDRAAKIEKLVSINNRFRFLGKYVNT